MELVCGYGKAEGIDQIEVHFLSAEGHAGLVGLVVLELLAGDPEAMIVQSWISIRYPYESGLANWIFQM